MRQSIQPFAGQQHVQIGRNPRQPRQALVGEELHQPALHAQMPHHQRLRRQHRGRPQLVQTHRQQLGQLLDATAAVDPEHGQMGRRVGTRMTQAKSGASRAARTCGKSPSPLAVRLFATSNMLSGMPWAVFQYAKDAKAAQRTQRKSKDWNGFRQLALALFASFAHFASFASPIQSRSGAVINVMKSIGISCSVSVPLRATLLATT